MGNTIDYNPYDYPYVRADEHNGTFSQQLYFAAGNSSVYSQILLIFFISSWLVVPVNWSMVYCFLRCGRVRSDMVFGFFWNIIFSGIYTAATGGFENRNAFVWIKNYSLVAGCFQIWVFKYITGFPTPTAFAMYSQSFIIHGLLVLNIFEASIWEVAVLGQDAANILNAISGFIVGITVPCYTYFYGVSIVEYYEGRIRAMRSNLTPTWIVAYTIWNIEYNAGYHPEEASFYIFATLLLPLGGAFWAGHDWLETRAYMLLHAINLRVLPWGGNGILAGTVGLWTPMYLNDAFRYTFSIAAFLLSLLSVVEIYFIAKGHKWWNYGLPKELILFDIVDPYPPESIAPIVHKVLGLAMPKGSIRKSVRKVKYVAGLCARVPGFYRHWGDNTEDMDKKAAEVIDALEASNNPVFDRESMSVRVEAGKEGDGAKVQDVKDEEKSPAVMLEEVVLDVENKA